MDPPNTIDRARTLTELENDEWGAPGYDLHLVRTVHALRHKPLQEFAPADLETIIGQNLSLPYVVPLALEHLRRDVLLEAAYYEGDLLVSMLQSDPDFWQSREIYGARLSRSSNKSLSE